MKAFVLLLTLLCVCPALAQDDFELTNIYPTQPGLLIRDIEFLTADIALAVGYLSLDNSQFAAVLSVTRDGGKTWSSGTLQNALLFDIDILNENEVSVVGFSLNGTAVVLRSVDGGGNWAVHQFDGTRLPLITTLYTIDYLNDNTMIAAGFDGSIVRTTDSGVNWTAENTDSTWNIWNMAIRGESMIAAAWRQPNIHDPIYKLYRSHDEGLSWSVLEASGPDGMVIEEVIYIDEGTLIGFGNVNNRYSVFKSVDNGQGWTTLYVSDDVGSLKTGYINSTGQIFGAGTASKVVYSLDGETWGEAHTNGEDVVWNVDGIDDKVWFTGSLGRVYEFNAAKTTDVYSTEAVAPVFAIYHSAEDVLSFHGLRAGIGYDLKIVSVDGRSVPLNLDRNGQVHLESLAGGAYVYALVAKGITVAGGKIIK